MRSIVLLAICAVPAMSMAQIPEVISPEQAMQHLVAPMTLAMPPIAMAAHVYGEVKVQIVVDPQGRPTHLTVLSGAPMLVGTAIKSVRQSSYRPFLVEGKPVLATTVVSLAYGGKTPLARGEKPEPLLPRFYEALRDCKTALQNKSKPEKQLKPCAEMAKLADSIPLDDYSVDAVESAYVDAASAFLNGKQFDQALAYATKAVARVELGFGDASTPCTAYVMRTNVELGLNDSASADTDLNKAETAERDAISWIQNDQLKQRYQQILKTILEFHAKLLTVAGDQTRAQQKLKEAAAL